MATITDWQKNTFYGTDAILQHFTHKFGKLLSEDGGMPRIYAILRKHTKGNRTMKRYTLAMKRKLVAEYATGDFPRKEFLSKHQIPSSTFHQWIRTYAEELLPALDAGMTVSSFRRLKNECDRKAIWI